ncbi:hypothetical protein HDU97_002963 [Phlyctochytrium planicorne]|nr:hypothetical protein HDU97_002963 [Phlyctochytrium planicorne]
MHTSIGLLLLASATIGTAQLQKQFPLGVNVDPIPSSAADGITAAPGVKVSVLISQLHGARSIAFDSTGNLLALSQDLSGIVSYKKKGDAWTGTTILKDKDLMLTHSMIIHDGYIYASSPSTVYRWPYIAGKTLDKSKQEVVVKDINGEFGGTFGHSTRTLVIHDGHLYVSIGSRRNIDPDSKAALIRRFALDFPKGGFKFTDGKIWGEGTRNNVAMAFDDQGRLWGAENANKYDKGADNLSRNDLNRIAEFACQSTDCTENLATDYHNDSPVEEVNIFDDPSAFYGYPFCFTAGNVTTNFEADTIRGSQWAWPNFMDDGIHDDEWCRDPANNRPPALHIPAHSAPITLAFFSECGQAAGSLPCKYKGNLFATLRGSWNRDLPQGYSVIMFESNSKGEPVQKIRTLVHATDMQNRCKGLASEKCFRPTGLAFSPWGTLIVSSDATGQIVELTFDETI